MATLRSTISLGCTLLACSALLLGAQSRLTDRFTPELNREQHAKTAQSQAAVYTPLDMSGRRLTSLIGYIHLVLLAGLLYPVTRRATAGLSIAYICLGVSGRLRTHRPIMPPLAVIAVLLGAML